MRKDERSDGNGPGNGWLSRFRRRHRAAKALYRSGVTQARLPVFYRHRDVADTVDGRFELIILHSFLIWNRVRTEGGEGARLAQALFDVQFRDLERALRLMGVGDLSIPHHIKRMMRGFKGRAIAYRDALENPDDPEIALTALRRNLFGTMPAASGVNVRWFAAYLRAGARRLAAQPWDAIRNGVIDFDGLLEDQDAQPNTADARMVAESRDR